jgi:hypothetical protein
MTACCVHKPSDVGHLPNPSHPGQMAIVEATNAKAAIEAAVREFRIDAKRLIAVRVRER